MTYVLLGMETQSVLYEADYRSEVNQHRLKANPSEPVAIINKRDLDRALTPTTTDDLKDKYCVRDYAVKQQDETLVHYHERLGKQLRKLFNKGMNRQECLTEMGISNSTLSNIQHQQGIKFKRNTKRISPEMRRQRVKDVTACIASGKTVIETAKITGIADSAIYHIVKAQGLEIKGSKRDRVVPVGLSRNGKMLKFQSMTKAAKFLAVSVSQFQHYRDFNKDIKGYSIIELTPEDVQA